MSNSLALPPPPVWGLKPRPSPLEWTFGVTTTSPESLVAVHTALLTLVTCRLHGGRDSERSSALLMSFRLNVKGKKKKRKMHPQGEAWRREQWIRAMGSVLFTGCQQRNNLQCVCISDVTRWRSAANKSSSFLLAARSRKGKSNYRIFLNK